MRKDRKKERQTDRQTPDRQTDRVVCSIKITNLQKAEAISFLKKASKLLGCVHGRTSIPRDSDQTRLQVKKKLFIM